MKKIRYRDEIESRKRKKNINNGTDLFHRLSIRWTEIGGRGGKRGRERVKRKSGRIGNEGRYGMMHGALYRDTEVSRRNESWQDEVGRDALSQGKPIFGKTYGSSVVR